MKSVHDNNIYSIEIKCEDNVIILHTKSDDGEAPKKTDIILKGVLGHQFENVLEGNIILNIEEWESEKLYSEFETTLITYASYGFPLRFSNSEEFCIEMQRKNLKAFVINSSYGLSGWIVANNMVLQGI